MKKTIITTALLIAAMATGSSLSAQEKASRPADESFQGHWFIGVQGGIGHTVGETSFGNLISPAAAFSFGYQFTPVWGLRAGLGGWQAKGAVVGPTQRYKYNYLQGNVDVMVDICSIFAGYKMSRAVNPYLFAGVGVNGAFNNDEAQALASRLGPDGLLWDGSKVLPVGRFGVGMGIRLVDAVQFNLELTGNFMGDSFNSKLGSAVDWQLGAQAGFTFKIGLKKNRKQSASQADYVPVSEPAPVSQPAPAQQPEPESQPAAPVTKPEPAPAAAVEVSEPAFEAVERDIYFTIGKSTLRDSEKSKVAELVEVLNAHPETSVTVTGHADAETGSAERNMELSKERARNVAAALLDAGISADRVTVLYKGDTANPYDTAEKNRVAVCIVDDADNQ